MVDWTGRTLRSDKRGVIPAHLDSILQRLEINEAHWIDGIAHYGSYFYKVVGTLQHLIAESAQRGKCWLRGQGAAKLLYQ